MKEATRSARLGTPEVFGNLLQILAKEKRWVTLKAGEIEALYRCLQSDDEVSTIFDLLGKVIYFDGYMVDQAADAIAATVYDNWGLRPEHTCFVDHDVDESRGSAKAALEAVRPKLAITPRHFQPANFPQRLEGAVINPVWRSIVLIDDFIGTGKKLGKKIVWINKKTDDNGLPRKHIYVCSFAAHADSFQRSQDQLVGHFTFLKMQKGISDRFSSKEAHRRKLLVTAVSNRFGTIGRHMHLGYGDTESLFFPQNLNTPNNVFPIFWTTKHNIYPDFVPISPRMQKR